MDFFTLLPYLTVLVILIFSCFFLTAYLKKCSFKLDELSKALKRANFDCNNLTLENKKLKEELAHIKALPLPDEKKVLTIEAQQILHDMTAHGHSIVKISPLSPSDIFWRSPK